LFCPLLSYLAQHLPNVPTSVLRGVLEEHTTPESLQMLSNLLTKQAGSPLHDSQVHVVSQTYLVFIYFYSFIFSHSNVPIHCFVLYCTLKKIKYDAVGRPVYTHNRNSKILKNCDMGKLQMIDFLMFTR
jgi:hypothetical protein